MVGAKPVQCYEAVQRWAVAAGRGGGGLVSFVRRRKKARVARWAAWAERVIKLGGPVWWDGGLGGLGRAAGHGRRSEWASWAGKEKKKEIH
jgi:hypothetical protein